MVDDDLLTLPEIAEMLRLNPSTIRLWVHEQRLPAHKAGARKWLVRRGDLERMLAEQPHIGHPKGASTSPTAPPPAPTDWSEVDIAGLIEPIRGIR